MNRRAFFKTVVVVACAPVVKPTTTDEIIRYARLIALQQQYNERVMLRLRDSINHALAMAS